jgi:multidrug resistance efflux pump
MRTVLLIPAWMLWVLARPFVAAWWVLSRVLPSFRFWLLVLLAFLTALVAYYIAADRYTPLSTDAYVQAYVVQIAPEVAGRVVRVHVANNQSVRAGEPLFDLDPRPFEHKVALLTAKLVETEQHVRQLGTELASAKAEQKKVEAETEYATAVHSQEEKIFRAESTTERRYLDALQRLRAGQAALDKATQAVRLAQEALEAKVGAEHALIAQVKAQLAEAKLNLAYCKVVAPCDGVVSDLQLREGAYVHVGQPAISLIETDEWLVVANFRENALRHVKEGQPALVAFQSAPGEIRTARVTSIGRGVASGQGVPSGRLPEVHRQASWVPLAQRFQVRLTLDDAGELPLRVGMTGSVSIYTEPEGSLNDVTRRVHQFLAWLYYL